MVHIPYNAKVKMRPTGDLPAQGNWSGYSQNASQQKIYTCL